MPFDDIALDITLRQYAQPHETTVEQVFRRAADVVSSGADDKLSEYIYSLMVDKKFSPGGRILAGAGTRHGNLLNCFVTDGSPWEPGTNRYALHLATKLALITRVGGGNGLNLDSFPPKRRYENEDHGTAYIVSDDPDVLSGTYKDLITDARVTKGYTTLIPVHPRDYAYIDEGAAKFVVEDDTESIWLAAGYMAQHLLYGKDVVIDVSRLRPEGSPVSGSGGTSSGPASFAVEIFDNFARWAALGGAEYAGPVATLRYLFAPTLRCIRQGGVRRGAGMATLSATHPDIDDFLTSKSLERERLEGDISTFNISVLASHEFMDNPSPTTRRIAAQAWATGEPGLLFVDTINQANPQAKRDGPILATNPCGEIGLYPGEPCDLGAMNVSEYFKLGDSIGSADYDYALEALMNDSFMTAEYLDTILDVERSPLKEIQEAIVRNRRIGLGMMGLGDALVKLGVPYDSEDARTIARDLAGAIRDGAMLYSSYAARLKGAPSGIVDILPDRRNVALLTVAPTGTTAMVLGTTSGIEPLFAPFIYRRVGTEYKQILHPLFREMLEQYTPTPAFAIWEEVDENDWRPAGWDYPRIIKAISDNHGSVATVTGLPKEVRQVFRCAHDIAPLDHVRMQAAIQNEFDFREGRRTWAGNSISKTINLPTTATVQDVIDVYEEAHRSGVKGITVYRDGSRDFQVLNTSMSEDDGSTAASQARDEQLQEIVAATCSLDGSCDV